MGLLMFDLRFAWDITQIVFLPKKALPEFRQQAESNIAPLDSSEKTFISNSDLFIA
jgi:hypothetical protein